MPRRSFQTHTKSIAVLAAASLLVLAASGLGLHRTEPREPDGKSSVMLEITLGIGDEQPTNWDGSLSLSAGRPVRSAGLRFEDGDQFDGRRWNLQTRHQRPTNRAQRERGRDRMPMDTNGLLVWLDDVPQGAVLELTTPHGPIKLEPAKLEMGSATEHLDGRVRIERLPYTEPLVAQPTEDDYPAAAVGSDGTVYVAFVSFTHGPGWSTVPRVNEVPKDWSLFGRPAGGDQLWLVRGRPGQWQEPVAVTAGGLDLWRPAVAVDGHGAVWVIWSEQAGGNWDVFARQWREGALGPQVRLSDDAGPDFGVAATTAADGTVWLAWQGFRTGNSEIVTTHTTRNGFAPVTTVSTSSANDWEPCIAAGPRGEVAIAWDSYDRGSYDVQCREWKNGRWGDTRAVAASARFEARPSAAYDGTGRLWIAWEDAGEGWGKDWGALDQQFVPLYRGRTVRVAVAADAGWSEPAGDFDAALRAGAGTRARAARQAAAPSGEAKKSDKSGTDQPKRAKKKNQQTKTAQTKSAQTKTAQAKTAEAQAAAPIASAPKLVRDAQGRVWLSTRRRIGNFRAPVGSVWYEHVLYHDGDGWVSPVRVPDSDHLLASRAAWAALPSGEMLMIAASDHRATVVSDGPRRKQAAEPDERDSVNSDIFVAHLGQATEAAGELKLAKAQPAEPAAVPDYVIAERQQVKAIRDYRAVVAGTKLSIVRGEFHRHTEVSADGGNDGSLIDMWRYAIDAAALDWMGCGDHDNGGGREYSWWQTQKTADLVHAPPAFLPMYSYERSMGYPDGHRNVLFARRGVRTLPRLVNGAGRNLDDQPDAPRPPTRDVEMLYEYLRHFGGICSSHTSGTDMGTDWRNNDPAVEPVVEIYQGARQNYEHPGAPRSNSEDNSIGGWRPLGFVSLALAKGYRLGFQSSSDHGSTHISYACVYVADSTKEAILDGIRRRHAYAATDNIIADVRSGEHFMGDEFQTDRPPQLDVNIVGTGPIARVVVLRDSQPVHTHEPAAAATRFTWTDPEPLSGTHYYYVRVEQENAELAWVSPMWIDYRPKP